MGRNEQNQQNQQPQNQAAQQNQQYQNRPYNQNQARGRSQAPAMNPFQGQFMGRNQNQLQNPAFFQGQNQAQQPRMATPEEMGITFEPIESLFGGAKTPEPAAPLPTAAPQMAAPQMTAPQMMPQHGPVAGTDIGSSLKSFIQNERNGGHFYKHLSECTARDTEKRVLEGVSATCRLNSQSFLKIYRQYSGGDFAVRETQIDTSVGFRDGVKWAVAEESLAIKDLSTLYESQEMDAYTRQLNAILGRKIGDLGALMSLIS
jgi:hypothetical protein